MYRRIVFLAALAALSGVAFGAFGAHALRGLLDETRLSIFHTGVEYQMWHALGLGLLAVLMGRHPGNKQLPWAAWLMFGGIVLFSGSLYLLSLTNIRWLGMITPFGGMAFVVAWLLLAAAALRLKP